MRKITNYLVLGLLSASVIACQKDKAFEQEEAIAPEVISQIKALGFGTSNIQRHEDGYLVEGDIVLTPEMLNSNPDRKKLIIAQEEQYRTTNLVTGLPRTITVSTTGSISSALSAGIDEAIARYNAENLQLTFVRGGSNGGGTINIRLVNTGQYIASAGFPSGGNPYPEVKYAKTYQNYSQGFIATVVAHEMGHCIGFRHTDYMNRSYSCGSGGNEGDGGVGAILIPGTPTGPDPNSWMLACLSATTNRPFNANDKIALNYLY